MGQQRRATPDDDQRLPGDDLPIEPAPASEPAPPPPDVPLVSIRGEFAGGTSIGDVVAGDKITQVYPPAPPRPGAPFSSPYPPPDQPLVGRDGLLDDIRARLEAAGPVRLALDGMPGAGKTRLVLALAFGQRLRPRFPGGVFLASLGQQPDLESVVRRWTDDLGLPHDPAADLDTQLRRFAANRTRDDQPYLLIVDDVWSNAHARPFLLPSPLASVLFTGRQRDQLQSVDFGDLVGSGNLLTIPPLDETQAVALLRQSAELPAPGHQAELEALAALVGGLPLLLAAIGRYLRDQHQRQQQGWFERALDDLQSAARRLNLPVASIEQARANVGGGFLARLRRKPVVALNSRVIVELSFGALPREAQQVFLRLAALPPDPLSFGADSAGAVAEAVDAAMLQLLVRRNLLIEAGDERFRLHRVLWDWAEQRDPRAVREARRYLADWHARLSRPDRSDEFGAWRHNPDNWQHMLQSWRAAVDDPEALRGAIYTILPLLIGQGYWSAVRAGLERALDLFRRVDRPLATLVRYHLGRIHFYLAEYAQARGYASAALQGFQEARREQGQGAALSLLGMIEQATGDYDTARRCYQAALDLTPDTDEHNYASCLNNLAELLRAQGDYVAARPLYERALAIHEQALGPLHPDTAISLNNLAALLRAQGDYAAARPLFERALQVTEQALGPQHPSTATSLNNLAGLLDNQGDYTASRTLYERALVIREQTLGPLHPDTATSLNDLAGLLESQGDYAAARPLYERALLIYEQALGLQHPFTATSLNNLAALLERQGDDAAARPLYERALAIREQVLGPGHPSTAASLNGLAALFYEQGDYVAAHSLFERALAIREQALGPQHPDTATSLNNLAALLERQGDYAAARPLYERALAIGEQVLGPDHPNTGTALHGLGHCLEDMGEYRDARLHMQRSLAIAEKAFGDNHPTTDKYRRCLAKLIQRSHPGAEHTNVIDIKSSSDHPLFPTSGDSTMQLFSHGRALIVGVGEYQDAEWSVPITAADAQGVAEALVDPAVGAYPPEQVRLLLGADATREGVTAALAELAKQTQPGDTVLIFFAGHGLLDADGTYCFATHDTVFAGKRAKLGTGLGAPALLDALRAITSQKLLFLVNACFSGHLAPATLGAPPSAGFNAAVLATGEGRAIITASRPTQPSVYMPGEARTFFGEALVEGLRGKAANGGGYVGLYELYQHVYQSVKADAAAMHRTQEPVLTIVQGVGPFPVALYPGASSGSLGAPALRQSPPAGTAVEQVPRNTVAAIGQGAQAFNIQSGGAVTIDQGRKLIDFGGANIQGGVKIGDVSAGNMVKVNVKIGASGAAKADPRQELLDQIAQVQAEVAGLADVPKGKRQDAEDELRKAREAGAEGDDQRLLEKLDSAQKILLALGDASPAALTLGETISALIQQAIAGLS